MLPCGLELAFPSFTWWFRVHCYFARVWLVYCKLRVVYYISWVGLFCMLCVCFGYVFITCVCYSCLVGGRFACVFRLGVCGFDVWCLGFVLACCVCLLTAWFCLLIVLYIVFLVCIFACLVCVVWCLANLVVNCFVACFVVLVAVGWVIWWLWWFGYGAIVLLCLNACCG